MSTSELLREANWSTEDLFNFRRKHTAESLSVSYANTTPLIPVSASGTKIVSLENNNHIAYLDTRNNVPHVGHNHPYVVQSITSQLSVMNTNTRYLHPSPVLLMNKLLKTFPPAMHAEEDYVVFLVNSGSEANDLALRLAQANSNNDPNSHVICVERAYHGHTVATVGLSPYKWGKNNEFKPDNVSKVSCPDTYRGGNRTAESFASEVGDICKWKKVSAFIVESGMSVAGVILPPPGYLKSCYEHVHKVGGVTIADEVQTGFGRFGKFYWGFEQQGVHPDIITVGKPFGNGMPLAAVVCRRTISDKFDACGIEYFNTFGGNLASASAGLAVLAIVEKESLQSNAEKVGSYLKQSFLDLKNDATNNLNLIGDVRGMGLFLGVELVTDQEQKIPATKETSVMCSKLKSDYRILTSIDGPYDNVLVIKPPMCFSMDDANEFLNGFKNVLLEIQQIDISKLEISHTPT